MILAPQRLFEGVQAYEPGETFLSGLQAYDASLFAYRNYRESKIVVFSNRKGVKVYEFSAYRREGVTWPELERKILNDLPMMDVWKQHGSGEAFDDFLANSVEAEKEKKLKKAKEERIDRVKEDIDRARFDLKINPRINVPINLQTPGA